MKTSSVSKFSFDEIFKFLSASSEYKYLLDSELGSGTLYTFKIEKGLNISIWDCIFKDEIELYHKPISGKNNNFFTIAYLLDKKGLNYVRTNNYYKKNLWWDNIFLSALADYAISFQPKKRFYCLSINFSYDWLVNAIKNNTSHEDLINKISSDNIFLFGKIENEEIEQIQKLVTNIKDCCKSFFIKSGVLRIISDFIFKLKQQGSFFIVNQSPVDVVAEVAAYLENHILEPLPNLKTLAHKYNISESTLKRRFKKHFGVSMSTYFSSRKLEHMQQIAKTNNNLDILPANLEILESLSSSGEAA